MSQQNTHPFGDDNAVRIIPEPAGILQLAQLRKTSEIREAPVQYLAAEGSIATGCFSDMITFIKNGKLENVVAVIKSCTPNMLGDLTVKLKDLSGMISGTIHYKVPLNEVMERLLA
ncbi:RNA-directed DNA polymerase, eukaryota [Tanacetum coccineum]